MGRLIGEREGKGKGKGKGKGDENPYIDLLVLSIIHGRKKERKKERRVITNIDASGGTSSMHCTDGWMDGWMDIRSFVVVVVWSIQSVSQVGYLGSSTVLH